MPRQHRVWCCGCWVVWGCAPAFLPRASSLGAALIDILCRFASICLSKPEPFVCIFVLMCALVRVGLESITDTLMEGYKEQ